VNCTKCVCRPGSAPTRCGSYSASPDSLAVIRGRAGRVGEEKVCEWMRKRKRRKWKDVKDAWKVEGRDRKWKGG